MMDPNSSIPTEPMFSTIAERYDRCNHLFSLGIDRLWRRRLARELALTSEQTALDICCGTGDMTFALLAQTQARHVVGVDCSERMIQLAQEKRMLAMARRSMANKAARFAVADAAALPYADGMFDAITCVFGLRNIPARAAVLAEMHRVLKSGGQAGICEFYLPAHPALRAGYWFYLSRVMPLAGRLVVGDAAPLRYLAESIRRWDADVRLPEELMQAGFAARQTVSLTGGIVKLTIGQKTVRPIRQL